MGGLGVAGSYDSAAQPSRADTESGPRALGAPAPPRPAWLPPRQQHRAAAVGGSAPACVELLPGGVEAARTLELVVVGQLLAGGDGAQRLQVDPPVLGDRLAVGLAGVVEEACLVAADAGVDQGVLVDGEHQDVRMLRPIVVVALRRLLGRDPFAQVLDQAGSPPDPPQGE